MCINKTFIAPAVLMNRSNIITNYEIGNFDLYMVKNLSTRQQTSHSGVVFSYQMLESTEYQQLIFLRRFSAMQFSMIRIGILKVETKGLKWLEEKDLIFNCIVIHFQEYMYIYILPVILSFGLKVLISVFLKSVSTSRLKGLHKNSKMWILIVIFFAKVGDTCLAKGPMDIGESTSFGIGIASSITCP